MDLDIISRVLEALEREQVRYIVCGAVAINLSWGCRGRFELEDD